MAALLTPNSCAVRHRAPLKDGRKTADRRSTGGFADGKAATARFERPLGVAVDAAGRIYVADTGNHRIRRIDSDGTVSTLAGSGKKGFANGPAADAQFDSPVGLCVAADGRLVVVDEGNHCVRTVTA